MISFAKWNIIVILIVELTRICIAVIACIATGSRSEVPNLAFQINTMLIISWICLRISSPIGPGIQIENLDKLGFIFGGTGTCNWIYSIQVNFKFPGITPMVGIFGALIRSSKSCTVDIISCNREETDILLRDEVLIQNYHTVDFFLSCCCSWWLWKKNWVILVWRLCSRSPLSMLAFVYDMCTFWSFSLVEWDSWPCWWQCPKGTSLVSDHNLNFIFDLNYFYCQLPGARSELQSVCLWSTVL